MRKLWMMMAMVAALVLAGCAGMPNMEAGRQTGSAGNVVTVQVQSGVLFGSSNAEPLMPRESLDGAVGEASGGEVSQPVETSTTITVTTGNGESAADSDSEATQDAKPDTTLDADAAVAVQGEAEQTGDKADTEEAEPEEPETE